MSSKKSHHRTEGPWYLKKKGWMGGGPFVIGKHMRVVADCGLDGEDGTYRRIENVDNARFISKTPEMFDLLKEAYLLLQHSNVVKETENGIIDKERWSKKYNSLLSKLKSAD